MSRAKRTWAAAIVSVLLVIGVVMAGCNDERFGAAGVTNYDSVHIAAPTYQATGTPALLVDCDGVNACIEIQDGGTAVWAVNDGGAISQTGDQSLTGNLSVSGHVAVAATAETTATPMMLMDSNAVGANLLEIRDAATPVFVVENGGDHTIAGNVAIAQPTAAATATPMVYGNTAADITDLLVLAKDGTAEIYVHNDGTVDLNGNKLDLDAAATTSITADTDNQIDIEINGADDFQFTANTFTALSGSSIVNNGTLTQVGSISDSDSAVTIADNAIVDGAADAIQFTVQGYSTQTSNLFVVENSDGTDVLIGDAYLGTALTNTTEILLELADTTSIGQSGTNTMVGLNVDLGIGDSTAGTNNVYGVLIDNITADAQNTETAIGIGGNGWDIGIDLGGNCLDLDDAATTSICADTDNQIDIEINGADDFQFTANTFTALSGSSIVNNGTLTQLGDVSDSGGAFTIADLTMIDGAEDGVQLTVQGYTTQTNSLLVLEQSDGTDVLTVTNAGNTDISGTLQYGADNLYPVGYATSGRFMYFGVTATFTGTTTVLSTTTGIENVVMILCTQNTPDEDAGDPYFCVGSHTDGDVTLTSLDDDGGTATAPDTAYYLIIGY